MIRQIHEEKSYETYSTERCSLWIKKFLSFKFLASGKIQRKSKSMKYLHVSLILFLMTFTGHYECQDAAQEGVVTRW